jgi:hypothetical protein
MPLAVPAWAEAAVTRRAGTYPPRELKARVGRWRATLRLRLAEEREVWRTRIGATHRRRARATVVTVVPSIGRSSLVPAVRSALAQTVTDHHVVVVSDGRPLPPLPEHPRLSVLRLSRGRGVAALVRNVGIRTSSSRFLAFLDDDNTWAPDHLERTLPALEDGADLAYAGVQWIADDGARLGTMAVPFERRRLRDEHFVDTSAMVMRRTRQARFRDVPRFRGDATFEDWELAWRVSRRGRVVHVPAMTARVRVHDGSLFSHAPGDIVDLVALERASAPAAVAQASVGD